MAEQQALALRDSDAVYNAQQIFSQHHAIVTIVQGRLDDPELKEFRWLDIACGQGQVLAQIDSNIGTRGRSKIHYFAFDIENKHLQHATHQAERAKVRCTAQIGNSHDLAKFYPPDKPFDLITCTNAFHELPPQVLPSVLAEAVIRLADNGSLFLYDMENLKDAEFGSLTWQRFEIESICKAMCDAFEIPEYRPEPGQWKHKSVSAWNLHIQRRLLKVDGDHLKRRKDAAIAATAKCVKGLLERRMKETEQALESLTTTRTETPDDEKAKMEYLSEFWSLHRAMRGVK